MSTNILENINDELLCKQFCTQVKIHRRQNGLVMLETPFTYPDGDQYPLYLKETPTGGVRVSDGGHTLLHLSYENDVDKFFTGTRSVLLDQVVAEQDIDFDKETGQFCVEGSLEHLADASFRLGQALTRVYDLVMFDRHRNKKPPEGGRKI